MNYIVLDLEWNQSADGKAYTNSRIPVSYTHLTLPTN